jgi:tripeptide aminopeptidase
MEKLVERFIRYAKINTRSDENSKACPSTPGQLELGRMLAEEMKEIGLQDISLDENGYVMASLPANINKDVPVMGFLAHLDTSPDGKADRVNPQIMEHLGKGLVLSRKENIILSPVEFPIMNHYIGQHDNHRWHYTSADDKAGIAKL